MTGVHTTDTRGANRHVVVIFTRHPLTRANELGLAQGRADGPDNQPTAVGLARAERAAQRIWRRHPTICHVTSAANGRSAAMGELLRSVFAERGRALPPLAREPDLNEVDRGDFESRPDDERAAARAAFYTAGAAYPNGEDLARFEARIFAGLGRTIARVRDRRTVAVVTSSCALKRVLHDAAQHSAEEQQRVDIRPCASFWVAYEVQASGAYRAIIWSAPGDGHSSKYVPPDRSVLHRIPEDALAR